MTSTEIAALDANQLEALITQLLQAREARMPAVAMEPPNPCTALVDPKWHTFVDVLTGHSVLQFRHPGAGWIAYAMPAAERAHLVALLAAQATVSLQAPVNTQPM
jgi:hypothetical protein